MRFQTSPPAASASKSDRNMQTTGGLVLSAVLLLFSTGCEKQQAPPATGPLPVSVITVHTTDVPLRNEWVGTMDGYVNAQIQPQVSGYLIKQTYREGSVVSKGQVLFQIDPRPFQAALDQAEGQVGQAEGALGQAKAQLQLAEINVNRDAPLAEQRAIAQSQLDNDKQTAAQQAANVRAAEAQIATARAAVETAKLNLGFTQVRSLISGVAGQATTQVGNLVGPNAVLTAVSQMNPIKVYFSISDSEYLALSTLKGKTSDLLSSSADLPLTLTLSNGDKYESKGHIVYVDRQLNVQTGAIRVAASFPNPGNVLRPGQFGRISAETHVQRNAILVPQAAIQELQGTQQAYIVGPDDKVKVVNVTLGSQVGTDWVVEGGLPAGSKLIVDNIQKLRAGVPVSPHAASPVAASDAAGR
ncbi:MAG: efflux RND transporter periplasmic adaptor subunit [Edaphobacter sp.]|uniref:efflux RND transporter periplasmic adaptor subunit n=1 Tax=Edaphobacter sp. TaxID=1934404 RepID=UPI002392CC8B|nr:efflux RND transporter periplasmic adaptor subunit [Edaphobacter sp.]MDE1174977.1 efflux RND transporter periplasmic adaptor subunit [Edaphobacter sp.]